MVSGRILCLPIHGGVSPLHPSVVCVRPRPFQESIRLYNHVNRPVRYRDQPLPPRDAPPPPLPLGVLPLAPRDARHRPFNERCPCLRRRVGKTAKQLLSQTIQGKGFILPIKSIFLLLCMKSRLNTLLSAGYKLESVILFTY